MKNEYLNQIAKSRDIVFDDIISVLSKACEEKVHHVIEQSDWSIAGIMHALESAGCACIEIFEYSRGQETNLCCSCVVYLPAGEVDGIKVSFSRYLIFDIDWGEIFPAGFGTGAIGMSNEMYDIDLLYEYFLLEPTSFDVNLFCD